MPIRLPTVDAIRKEIAERAAEITSGSAQYLSGLLGPVEAVHEGRHASEARWRLAYYHGTPSQNAAIEQAAAIVQRAKPFIQAD